MKKVSLIVHNTYVESLVRQLHESGLVELIDIQNEEKKSLDELEKGIQDPEAVTLNEYELRLTRLIDILKKYKSGPSGIKALLNPQPPELREVEEKSAEELYSYLEGELHNIERGVIGINDKLIVLNDRRLEIDHIAHRLQFFRDFDVDLGDLDTSGLVYMNGGITEDLPALKESLKGIEEVAVYSRQFKKKKKEVEWAVIIVAHKSHQEKVERIVRDYVEVLDSDQFTGSPKEVLHSLREEEKTIRAEEKKIKQELQKYSKEHLVDLFAMREETHLLRIRAEVPGNFGRTESTSVVYCWVLEKHEKQLKQLVHEVTPDFVVYTGSKPSEKEEPPTYIETPWWAESYKMFLSLFSLPKYDEFNPTIPMGLFFVVFFGLMLGDAGYGLCILLLSLFAFIKLGKASPSIKSLGFMGICMGATTTTAGILMNSFFGDFIPRFIYGDPSLPMYQLNIGGILLPLDPLKDPLLILTIALICGLIHLNIGILFGAIQEYRRGNLREMVMDHLAWYPMQLGGGALIGMFILDWQLSEGMLYVAAILTVIGVICLMVQKGPIGFFDITGYVGDWLSYARLLALGLATAGMALAFNVVSELFGEMIPFVGIIIMIVMLIVLHLVNLALQALGAGVHSLRLQYVELFNRFYGGGGREFSPLKVVRRYTKVIEEK